MIEWISDHSKFLNIAINLATLVVWVAYFQLLFFTFRRANRPNILINRSAGEDADSHCIVSNMSASPIYVQAVTLDIERDGHHFSRTISDTEKLGRDASATQSMEQTTQGPLKDGDFVDIGTFRALAEKALTRDADPTTPGDLSAADSLTVTVLAVYTAKNDVVGARRRFTVESRGQTIALTPETPLAEQLKSRSQRRHLIGRLAA